MPIDEAQLRPLWEVFNAETAITIGYARACHVEEAISMVLTAAGVPDGKIDADLVAVDRLETVPAGNLTMTGYRG